MQSSSSSGDGSHSIALSSVVRPGWRGKKTINDLPLYGKEKEN
ncbi:hypothetical protein A54_63 [Septuagintavirus sv54]|uniref:Uncharacterized protein n=1 Tax=Escherichia phage A5-4 TaxID=2996162 RepID=A0AAE9TI40_9CAUD|nr:hypothetical protein A54_63 [Escherichia phage A5-4]